MKKTLFTCLFLVAFFPLLKAQLAIGFYVPNSWVEVSSNPEANLFGNLRLQTNSAITNLNAELSGNYNITVAETYNWYVGMGLRVNPFTAAVDEKFLRGYFLRIGARLTPFREARNFGFVLEVSPYVNSRLSAVSEWSGRVNSNLGLTWYFNQDN